MEGLKEQWKSTPRRDIESIIAGELRAKANKSARNAYFLDDATVTSLSQQGAMLVRYSSRLAAARQPSKLFEATIAEVESKRLRKADEEEDDPFAPVEPPEDFIEVVAEGFEYTADLITVRSSSGNNIPSIISEPIIGALVDEIYSYRVVAVDGEGDELTYSLITAPAGMTISSTGLVVYTPDEPGIFPVEVEVTDGVDSVRQSWNLQVGDLVFTTDLQFISTPITQATGPGEYEYRPIVRGGTPAAAAVFSLLDGPSGMSINPATGKLEWLFTPGEEETSGRVTILARKTDPATSSVQEASQTFRIDLTSTGDQAPPPDPAARIRNWSAVTE